MVISVFYIVGIAVPLWLILMLAAIVAGWFKRGSKHQAIAGKHQPGEDEHQLAEAKHQAAMKDFGVVERTGDELRMGWFEHIFVLETPVACVDEVWTRHGFASFTPANRCIVITDGQRLVILDREKDHGVRLEISQSQWFDASIEVSSVILSCYKQHGGTELAQRFVIETHTDHNNTLVPEGWPWKSTLFPEFEVSSH